MKTHWKKFGKCASSDCLQFVELFRQFVSPVTWRPFPIFCFNLFSKKKFRAGNLLRTFFIINTLSSSSKAVKKHLSPGETAVSGAQTLSRPKNKRFYRLTFAVAPFLERRRSLASDRQTACVCRQFLLFKALNSCLFTHVLNSAGE